MIELTRDELGNTYVDKKGIFWEICDSLGEQVMYFYAGGPIRRRIYQAVSSSGLTKVFVDEKGTFLQKYSKNDNWYEYHDSNGELRMKIEYGKLYTPEELGRKQ